MNHHSNLIRQMLQEDKNKQADYWFWLARPDVGTEDACLLIANIQPGSLSEQCLSPRKKSLLVITRSLVSESGIERLPALGWLRWAVEHKELLTDYGAEKEHLQKILRAVDRNSDQQQKAELELRQKLEQERAVREAAEAEVAELRQQLGNAKTAYEWLRRENRAAHDGWKLDQAESTRKGQELAAANAELERMRLQATDTNQAGQQHEAPATGLTFPYATKELEAMRAAVAKYWEGYTTDKRQPTQKEVSIELGELLGLPRQGSGDPNRKAMNLAAAIKPVDLPDA
ncbi:hypothetical protein SAMN04244579_03092 [Azotobacter beijerinckii]|uniref:Uncharacterized protein n=1 Tax=Azotobacter beijerinckii TaxID=170623 RepID=A0A1H6VXW4_9GAMM|nr:hypothetical protein [Azotobacter beijerinckii]SEJ09479.1 hypothetical protein SAMN04244579_03092 [Azotobacter beijerinckii]